MDRTPMDHCIEKDCVLLSGFFTSVISDLKGSTPVWDDFVAKATKLHGQLKATLLTTGGFLEAFQKVADLATHTRGSTREIGAALTRLCLRHRAIESRLKAFTSAIMDSLVIPLQDKIEEWKKNTIYIDKEHAKEYKRLKSEIKRRASDTVRLQKKVRKGGRVSSSKIDSAMQVVSDHYHIMEENEKQFVRHAMVEERSRICAFVAMMKPLVDEEILMLQEVTHVEDIMDSFSKLCSDPTSLPPASEQVIKDLKGIEVTGQPLPSPPSSPSSIGSRKSSICSINSLTSSSSGSTNSHSPSHHFRHRSMSQITGYLQPPTANSHRLSSVSSQDSGFTSQEQFYMQAPIVSLHSAQGQSSSDESYSNSSTPSSTYPTPSANHNGPLSVVPPPWESRDPNNKPLPHTVSCATHRHRPALAQDTFVPPERQIYGRPRWQAGADVQEESEPVSPMRKADQPEPTYAKPMLPHRSMSQPGDMKPPLPHRSVPKNGMASKAGPPTVPDFHRTPSNMIVPQPVYMNVQELHRDSSAPADIYRTVRSNSLPPQHVNEELREMPVYAQNGDCHANRISQASLPSSSGYGTLSTTSSGSTDGLLTAEELAERRDSFVCHYALLHTPGQRPHSTSGVPAGYSLSPSGTMRRKPPPPVRRTPSVSSNGNQHPQHRRNRSLDSDELDMPPPPPPVEMDQMNTNSNSNGNSNSPMARQAWVTPPRRNGTTSTAPLPVAEGPEKIVTHASVIESLNARFAEQQRRPGPGTPRPSQGDQARRLLPQTPGSANNNSESHKVDLHSTLLTQIQRGVRLRKAISNDRSAPHV